MEQLKLSEAEIETKSMVRSAVDRFYTLQPVRSEERSRLICLQTLKRKEYVCNQAGKLGSDSRGEGG